jgi:hypothetical protein
MRVMLIVMKERKAPLDGLYDSIAAHVEQCDIFRLTDEEQEELPNFFRRNAPSDYDRVVVFSRIKRLAHQASTLRWIRGLVFLEYDAWQNYMAESKNHGLFSRLYLATPNCRVISSGQGVSARLCSEGIDARFVPKGFDDRLFVNQNRTRNVFAAFVGSIKHQSYAARRRTLEGIRAGFQLDVMQTESGQPYIDTLNDIRIFVSADSGMGEYMLKNFEAMACGCVLLAQDQGEAENRALGFIDMENVALYRSPDEAIEKLKMLEAQPDLCDRLARAGSSLAWERFTFSRLGEQIAQEIQSPADQWQPHSLLARIIAKMRYPWLVTTDIA